MKPYLNCWKVTELSMWDLQTIKDLGFKGIRFDVNDAVEIPASVVLLEPYGLEAIALINGGKMPLNESQTADLADAVAGAIPPGFPMAIEVGNEPDISENLSDDHDGFGRMVNAAAMAVAARTTVISGGIFNTGQDGLEYLSYALRWIDPSVHVGVHSYRQDTTPFEAKRPWKDRTEEWAEIRRVAGSRPVWCTETGWHTANFPIGFGWRNKRWTDEEVRQFLTLEIAIQGSGEAVACVLYQWTDGPSDEAIDRFGLKLHAQQVLKPQAQCLKCWQ